MPESFIQVAPDSTGAKLRVRERTIGSNVVEEQYVIPTTDRVVTSRSWLSSLRIPNRNATSQPLFTIWNGGTNLVSCRRLAVEVDSATGSTALAPVMRLYRLTAAPTGGTVVAHGRQDTNETMSAGVVARCDAQTDGASATTALAATANPVEHLWQQVVPRWGTMVGYGSVPILSMLPDDSALLAEDPMVLRPSQGLLIRAETVTAPAAGLFQFFMKAAIGEFTIP